MTCRLQLENNQVILFTGDSITDAGREESAYAPLGQGYVHFAANLLLAGYPKLNLNIINTGIGGDTTRDLKERWHKDCICHQPDILTVLIGVNDIWRQYDCPEEPESAVYPEEFESNYRGMLSAVKDECECKIVLMEPFLFCDDAENPMLRQLRIYIEVVHNLAVEFDALLVPLQNRVDEVIRQTGPAKWSDDMVHPYLWAHAWLAQRWLETTGLCCA